MIAWMKLWSYLIVWGAIIMFVFQDVSGWFTWSFLTLIWVGTIWSKWDDLENVWAGFWEDD